MIHKIKALYDNGKGLSMRQIAETLNISRNSVRKYLNMEEADIGSQQEASSRTKLLDVHRDYIEHLLRSYPNLSAVKIMRKLQDKHNALNVSDRTVRRYIENLREIVHCRQKRYYQPVLDMVPGVQCQVDGGELRRVIIGGTETTVYFVVFVLSYSRLMYVGLSAQPINTDILIRMHDAAFRYFGGRVEECVYDQTKLVVINEEYRELTLNQRFHEYATYAGFTIRACEGYDPESKGKVEAGVKYAKYNGLYGEEFADWTELEAYQEHWLSTIANVRCHGTTGRAPMELYEESERMHMLPYNTPPIVQQDGQLTKRKSDKTSLISWQASKYSVPQAYQSTIVGVDEQDDKLVIYDLTTNQEIARHGKAGRAGQIVQNRNHYRDLTQLVSDLEAKITELVGAKTGEKLCILLKKTSAAIYKDQLHGVIKILSAVETQLATEVIERLCQRQRLTATSIRDYLQAYINKPKEHHNTEDNRERDDIASQLARYEKVLSIKGGKHAIH